MKLAFSKQGISIAIILLLAAVLYLYQLGTESLWTDEIISILDAEALPKIVKKERPLYYILLRFWMLLGTSETWLRGLSVLFGLGSVFLIYQLGRRLLTESIGLIAALLMTLSPLFIFHSQEVRMYALSVLLSLSGTLALAHALENPTRFFINWWIIARILMLLTTPLSFPLLLADIVLLWVQFRNQRHILLMFGKRLLLISTYWLAVAMYVLLQKTHELGRNRELGGLPDVNEILVRLIEFTAYLHRIPFSSSTVEWLYRVYAVMLIGLLVIALFKQQPLARLNWLRIWALLPLGVFFLISPVSSKLWAARHMLFAVPYLLILLATGFVRIWNQQRTIAILVSLVYAIAVGWGLTSYYTVQDRIDWRGVAQVISSNEKPGDVLAISTGIFKRILVYYYHGSAPIYSIWAPIPPPPRLLDKPTVERAVQELPSIQSRLWLVYKHISGASEQKDQMFRSVVEEQFCVQNYQEFEEIDLFLITSNSTLPSEKSP